MSIVRTLDIDLVCSQLGDALSKAVGSYDVLKVTARVSQMVCACVTNGKNANRQAKREIFL
jgi:hypothetical protein